MKTKKNEEVLETLEVQVILSLENLIDDLVRVNDLDASQINEPYIVERLSNKLRAIKDSKKYGFNVDTKLLSAVEKLIHELQKDKLTDNHKEKLSIFIKQWKEEERIKLIRADTIRTMSSMK